MIAYLIIYYLFVLINPISGRLFYSEPLILDRNTNDIRIDVIARVICDQSRNFQIAHFSTLKHLSDYFKELPDNHEFVNCRTKYHKSLEALENVIETQNDNVCGSDKLSAIEHFHRKFISNLDVDKIEQKEEDEISWIVKNFFRFYVVEISAICKRSIKKNLENDISKMFNEQDYEFTFGRDFMSRLTDGLGNVFNSVHHYDDVFLPMDLLQADDKSGIVVDLIDDFTGERVKLLIATHNASLLQAMQLQCRNRFRPIYSKIILPVVRLADLGYSYTDGLIEAEEIKIRENEFITLWYVLTQFCETIIPIKLYQDEEISPGDASLITLEESKTYKPYVGNTEEIPLVIYEPKDNKMDKIDALTNLNNIAARDAVKRTKSYWSARKRNINRALARSIRSMTKMATFRVILSNKAACSMQPYQKCKLGQGFIKEDLKSVVKKPQVDQGLIDLEGNATATGSQVVGSHKSKRAVSLRRLVIPFFSVAVLLFVIWVFLHLGLGI